MQMRHFNLFQVSELYYDHSSCDAHFVDADKNWETMEGIC